MHPPPVIISAPPTGRSACWPRRAAWFENAFSGKFCHLVHSTKKNNICLHLHVYRAKVTYQNVHQFVAELANLSRCMKNMYFRDIFQRLERLKTFTHVSRKSPFCRGPHFTYSVHFSPTHKHTPHNIVPKFLDSTL